MQICIASRRVIHSDVDNNMSHESMARYFRGDKTFHQPKHKKWSNAKPTISDPPLHIAIKANNIDKCAQLCKSDKTDVNISDVSSTQNRPLHNAVKNLEIVKVLCSHQYIQINTLNIHGQTALHCAVSQRCYATVEYLCSIIACDVNIIGKCIYLIKSINSHRCKR
jgi:ankyrin repeat protein